MAPLDEWCPAKGLVCIYENTKCSDFIKIVAALRKVLTWKGAYRWKDLATTPRKEVAPRQRTLLMFEMHVSQDAQHAQHPLTRSFCALVSVPGSIKLSDWFCRFLPSRQMKKDFRETTLPLRDYGTGLRLVSPFGSCPEAPYLFGNRFEDGRD